MVIVLVDWAAIAALEQRRQVLPAKAPSDYQAAVELAALMPLMARGDEEVKASAVAIQVEAETEALVNDPFLPLFVQRVRVCRCVLGQVANCVVSELCHMLARWDQRGFRPRVEWLRCR